MKRVVLIAVMSLPLLGAAQTNIPPFTTGDPLDVVYQRKPTNIVVWHYNSWGVATTNSISKADEKILYPWRDDSARARFNAFHTNMVMGTNGIITKK